MTDVLIIGGGLAGLAAGVACAEAGLRVTVLEARPRLGGRASSFEDSATGEVIDNCQHVAMGCCTNFFHFCRVTGLDQHLRRETQLTFVGPPGRDRQNSPRAPDFYEFRASPFRLEPYHLSGALMGLKYLSLRDKAGIAWGLLCLLGWKQLPGDRTDFAAWLRRNGQTSNAIERFWNVVLVSALSESLDRISVAAARKVFVDGFLANRAGWEVWLPTAPLDELYSGTLSRWLTTRGVELRLKTGVEQFIEENGRISEVRLRGGECLAARHFVLAVPHQRVLSLLPESLRSDPNLAGIERLENAPIVSVHLWFDRPLTSLPHAMFVGRLSQWMFNRGRGSGGGGRGGGSGEESFYYQVVISNARELAARPQADVVAEVAAELKEVWPWAAAAELRHSRVVVEHHAVFSPLPGSDELRPSQQSPIANLQLAGDWTRTGWPATMEGAVRSGFLAAENVLQHTGRAAQWLQPDLPMAWMLRMVAGR